jgi:hypothetical protein
MGPVDMEIRQLGSAIGGVRAARSATVVFVAHSAGPDVTA